MYDIVYNDETGRSHGIYIARRPFISPPEEEIKTYTVGGRDGMLTGSRRYMPLEITVEAGFKEKPGLWASRFRDIKTWLSGSGTLQQSDDKEWFYKVLSAKIDSLERNIKRYGIFQIKFTCDPYTYRLDGLKEYEINDSRILHNPCCECHPVYIFPGSAAQTLTVNGNQVTVNKTGAAIVDTDRMVTLMQSTGGLKNTWLDGDYEDLYLKRGTNTITSSGTVRIIPNWRQI